jgi:hypothetical protein
MGYAANYADVIEWSQIRKIVPKEARAMQRALKKANVSLDDFCQAMERDGWESDLDSEASQQVVSAWASVSAAFTKATAVKGQGLTLAVRFHNADNDGDRYDDVSGGFFHVDGVYQLTPAGRQFAAKIERKFFVTFG